MCGRYALDVTGTEIAAAFAEGLGSTPGLTPATRDRWRPRWNLAPTQAAPVIRLEEDANPVVDLLRWGLVPAWARDPGIGARMINARGETAHEKPAYRASFRSRRCLVPVRAFYEWRREGGRAVPHAIHGSDGGLLSLAGLWDRAEGVGESPLETFTIVTTAANRAMAALHDRMPVILDGADRARWLDRDASIDDLRSLLRSGPEDRLRWHPVSTRVNRPVHDDASLLTEVVPDRGGSPGLFDAFGDDPA